MTGNEILFILIRVALVVGAIWLAWVVASFIFRRLFVGAVFLFEYAGEQGFMGLAAYFACWFFLFPIMVIGSFVAGWISLRAEADFLTYAREPEESRRAQTASEKQSDGDGYSYSNLTDFERRRGY